MYVYIRCRSNDDLISAGLVVIVARNCWRQTHVPFDFHYSPNQTVMYILSTEQVEETSQCPTEICSIPSNIHQTFFQ